MAEAQAVARQVSSTWSQTILDLLRRNYRSGADIALAEVELYKCMVREVLSRVPAIRACVRIYDEKDRSLRFAAWVGDGWDDGVLSTVITIEAKSAAQHALEIKSPFIVSDVSKEIHYYRLFDNCQSLIALPIYSARLTAVLGVDGMEINVFNQDHVSALQVMVGDAVTVFDHFMLVEDRWLFDLDQFLSQSGELTKLCADALTHIKKLFGVRGCSIFLKDHSNDTLTLAASTSPMPIQATYSIGEGLTGWVAKVKKTLRLRNTADQSELSRIDPRLRWQGKYPERIDYTGTEGHQTFLASPLISPDGVVGVVRLTIKENRPYFTTRDEQLLESAAGILGLAIQNSWLKAETRRQLDQLSAFARIDEELAGTLDLEEVCQIIIERSLGLTKCAAGHMRVFDNEARNLELHGAVGLPELKLPRIRGLGEGIAGKVAQTRSPFLCNDLASEKTISTVSEHGIENVELLLSKGIKSAAWFPLIVLGDQLVGTLCLLSDQINAFGPDNVSPIRVLCNRSALAIKAALLFREIDQKLLLHIHALEDLRDVGSEFAQTLDLDVLLTRALEAALAESGIRTGTVRMLTETRDSWELKAAIDKDNDLMRLDKHLLKYLPVKDDFLKKAADARKPVLISDTDSNVEFKTFFDAISDTKQREWLQTLRALVVVPMCIQDACLGLIVLGSKDRRPPTDSTLRYLQILAAEAAVAIHAARLHARHALRQAQPLVMMGAMMSGFSHHMRGGLHRLSVSLNLISRLNHNPTSVLEAVAEMKSHIAALDRTITEVATFAGKGGQIAKQAVEVNRLLTEFLNRFSIPDKIVVTCNIDPVHIRVRGNPIQIRQAVELIVGNAIDAMPNGGKLDIYTMSSRQTITIGFRDTGVGMDDRTLSQCKIPFFSSKENGTGMGLAVADAIMAWHDGEMNIQSAQGKGTLVELKFPQTEELYETAAISG